jgi:hypothetical protein
MGKMMIAGRVDLSGDFDIEVLKWSNDTLGNTQWVLYRDNSSRKFCSTKEAI